jgi:lysophospholipase L1-like esterase
MKIYFDGCSWTYGTELENPEQERWSTLISQKLSADHINMSEPGAANDRIVRNLLNEVNIEDYDLAIIQLTYPLRTEFHTGNGWKSVNMIRNYRCSWKDSVTKLNIEKSFDGAPKEFNKHKDFWIYYYLWICNETYFETKEKIAYETIKSFCFSKNIPLILLSIDHKSKLDYDLNLTKTWKKYPTAPQKHPNKEGHKMIAEDILNIITSQQLI